MKNLGWVIGGHEQNLCSTLHFHIFISLRLSKYKEGLQTHTAPFLCQVKGQEWGWHHLPWLPLLGITIAVGRLVRYTWVLVLQLWASQVMLVVKNPPANAGDGANAGSIPGSGRSPGGGHGNPLQYSCLENPMDKRTLVGCSPWGRRESQMTEVT